MESKADRIMCGTCVFWNGGRELTSTTPLKVVTFDEYGTCECPVSSKSGEKRKRDLKCKEYLNWVENI